MSLSREEAGLPYYHLFEIHLLRPSEAAAYLRRAGGHIVKIQHRFSNMGSRLS